MTVKNFPAFCSIRNFIIIFIRYDTGSYFEPDKSSAHLHILLT